MILDNFFALFHKSTFSEKIYWKKYVFWIHLKICSVKFLILRRIQTHIELKVHFSSCNYCRYFVDLLYSFLKSLQISTFFNVSSGNQLRATTNLLVTFPKFVKAPNIFHFVTHLKYPKSRTYLHLNRRGYTCQWCNGRSQLLAHCMSRSNVLQKWHTRMLLCKDGRENLDFGIIYVRLWEIACYLLTVYKLQKYNNVNRIIVQ